MHKWRTTPNDVTATFGQPGQSHRYSVNASSRPESSLSGSQCLLDFDPGAHHDCRVAAVQQAQPRDDRGEHRNEDEFLESEAFYDDKGKAEGAEAVRANTQAARP